MKNSDPQSKSNIYQRYRRLSLGTKILIFMVIGLLAGIVFGEEAQIVQPLGDLFIRLLMMAAIPLVFFNLLGGLTSLTDLRSLGRISLKISLFYLSTTVLALILSLITMHLLKPGVGMQLTEEVPDTFGQVPGVADVILNLVPDNVFKAFSTGQMSQVVVFAVFLAITTLMLPKNQSEPLQKMFGLLARLFRNLVNLILAISPVGIGALTASTVGQHGKSIFGPLAIFIGGVWGTQAIMIIIYMILLVLFTKQSPVLFFKQTAPLYATTVSTCSSLASLAVSLEVAEDRVKLPRSIYSFTLPLGAQLNKNGTSIMLAAVLLFTAQAAGVEFSLVSQVTIVLVGLMLETGSGGIPGGGLVVALIFVKAFNLPLEIAAIVGGIYRLIDMGSTTINCMGDMVGTVIVAHSEKKRVENKIVDDS
jgi:Na+/H+-dicarboxylate symporter